MHERVEPILGSAWLGGSDRQSHGTELGGLAACVLERRAGLGVDEVALGDVGVGPLDQQARVRAHARPVGKMNSCSWSVETSV
jgi:hypothetical protein